jgi:N-methylhydantoinase A
LGEYERTSATAINAYVRPLVERYLARFRAGLRELGCSAELYLMTSSGGTMTADTAIALPIHLAESGPAAGALIAGQIGTAAGRPDVLAFDMGGTTAKVCLIRGGKPLISKNYEVARLRRYAKGSGLPLGVPVVDLLEIGAGGGSIAELDEMGLPRVGPRSASADPGPACYGSGGTEPTVTDANVVLGLIRPEAFLGGTMKLDRDAAIEAIDRRLAKPLGIEVEDAALAIHRIVTENMAEAARVHAVEMNVDLRGMGMVAFGGAGPIHAHAVASRLGLSYIVCARQAGVLSAYGLLRAPVAFEFARSWASDLADLDTKHVNAVLADLRARAEQLLVESGAQAAAIEYSVDMCYVGQRFEVTTPIESGVLTRSGLAQLKRSFDETYQEAYGRRLDDVGARCVTWRVLASGSMPSAVAEAEIAGTQSLPSSEDIWRDVILPNHGHVQCRIVPGADLSAGSDIAGPAIIEEVATAIVVPPGMTARVDERGNIVLVLDD